MFYILFLWGWRVRVKSRIPRNDLFFLKRLKFPEATKIIAFSRNGQKKADQEDVGIMVRENKYWYVRHREAAVGWGNQQLSNVHLTDVPEVLSVVSKLLEWLLSHTKTPSSKPCCWIRPCRVQLITQSKHTCFWLHSQGCSNFWEPEIACCCRSLICKIALRHCRKTSRWWGGARWQIDAKHHA